MQTSAEESTSLAPGSLSLYLSEISKYPLLSVKEEQKLARQFLRKNLRAGHKLVTSNLRFVVKWPTSIDPTASRCRTSFRRETSG